MLAIQIVQDSFGVGGRGRRPLESADPAGQRRAGQLREKVLEQIVLEKIVLIVVVRDKDGGGVPGGSGVPTVHKGSPGRSGGVSIRCSIIVFAGLWRDQGGMKREPASPGGPGGVPGYSFGGHLEILSGQFCLS